MSTRSIWGSRAIGLAGLTDQSFRPFSTMALGGRKLLNIPSEHTVG